MGQTVVEKITQRHAVDVAEETVLRAGDFVTVMPDLVMTHDNTTAVLDKFESLGMETVHDPRQPVFALDHDIQNTSPENLARYARIESFAKSRKIDFYPAGTGIGHQVMTENGYVKPGGFCVASDSHANMYGALGAVGTPVVRTDAAAIWATGRFWWQIPRTVRVHLTGELRDGVTGKDVILTLCGLYSNGEVLNAAIEFAGPGVDALSMDARMTIANMTTEWGALTGWFPCDTATLDFFRKRRAILKLSGIEGRVTNDMLDEWEEAPLRSDPDAVYAGEIELDLSDVGPHVAGPDTVQRTRPLAEIEAEGVAIQKAYLLSCANSRLEDLKAAADVLLGNKVAPTVEFYVAAASQWVEDQARTSGIWQVLLGAGAVALPPGCGPCIGLGTGLLEEGEVGISATNRNFKGRMGSPDAVCYLASPAVVAASAVAGRITGPDGFDAVLPAYAWREGEATAPSSTVEIIDGFPASVDGRVLWLDRDDMNTDGIYGKDYTYRDDMTPDAMARVVMANYDPGFADIVREGDVVVGGFNFGTGSSREQAVTALQAAGVGLLIAGSFSQTYLRNAINNGFVCLESPAFVEAVRTAHPQGERTQVLDAVTVDFATARISWNGGEYGFAGLGRPVQEVIVAGGIENLVRASTN